MEFKLIFSSADGKVTKAVYASNFDSLHHAEQYGHLKAAEISAEKHFPIYLQTICEVAEKPSFSLLPVPSYYKTNTAGQPIVESGNRSIAQIEAGV